MFKFNIINMQTFLETVNECSGAVNVIQDDGCKKNINKKWDLQSALKEKYEQNNNSLKVTLSISEPKDYLKIVNHLIA